MRLIYELGGAIIRCKGVEIFVSTTLFMFWAADDNVDFLKPNGKKDALRIGAWFLRNCYLGFTLSE